MEIEVIRSRRKTLSVEIRDGHLLVRAPLRISNTEISRFLQEKLGEELGDYELEVGSAGIGQPFKVIQQYRNHIGKDVEVLANDGKKFQGVLKEVMDDDTKFVVTVKEKQQVEGKKRPVLVEVDETFAISDIKYCKYLLNFK